MLSIKNMPLILLGVILIVLFGGDYLPLEVKQVCYALSLTIKAFIVFVLPFIIFGLLFNAAITLADRATSMIGLILLFVCSSNFVSTFLSHYVGEWAYHFDLNLLTPNVTESLQPTWSVHLPVLFSNDKAMLAAIIFGIMLVKLKPNLAATIAPKLDQLIYKVMRYITLIIPVFVTGFIFKLQFDGVIQILFQDYSKIFILVALAQFSYILLLYLLVNGFNLGRSVSQIRNMLPAVVAGFSAMSSAAAMPLTIMAAEKNLSDKALARSIIPATVNIHLIGDCFAIPIFAYAVMKSYGYPEPALMTYLVFVTYFVIAKFSVAAIPGGGVLVMLPILESKLGFNSEMLSLVTALYILFDPIITSANVFGNGAFAKVVDRLLQRKKAVVIQSAP